MATPLEVIASELLKSAIDAEKLFGKTKDQSYKDKAVRLRRIVANLQELTIGTSSVATLNDLTDVTISAPANGQVLTYNSTTNQWENLTPAAGGGGDMLKSTYDVDNTGVVDNAEAISIIGRNSTGATLYRGTIVYISGSTGNRPNFAKAQANAEATSAGTFGVVRDDIANNADGFVTTLGYLDNLDTRTVATHPFTDVTLADGDTVYLHPTIAGYITNVKPSAPNHIVYVGKVTRTSPTNGTIVYRIQNGYELDEIHDVAISSKANNDLLVYESATNLWKNKTFSAIFGGTPLVSIPTLDQVTTAGNTTTNAITVGGLTSTLANANVTHVGANAKGFYIRNNADSLVRAGLQFDGNTAYVELLGRYQNGAVFIRQDGANGNISFLRDGSEYLRIFGATGNTAIGTTTDAGYKLDVNGTARVVTRLELGTFTPGAGVSAYVLATTGIITAAGGYNLRSPVYGDSIFSGLVDNSGPTIMQANTNVVRFNTVGGALNGTNVDILQGYNPGAGTGSVNGYRHAYGLYPTADNTISYTSFYSNPYWSSSPYYGRITGPIRGFYFVNGLYNTQKLVDVIAFQSAGGRVLFEGELPSASAGISRGVYINQTHTAAANNDVLVGLDINPTFTNGAFTGVSNLALRVAYVSGRYISFTQRPGYADYGRIQFTNVTGADIYSSGRIDLIPSDTDQSVVLGNGLTSRRLASSTNYGTYGPTPPGFLVTANAAFVVLSANIDVNTDSFVFSGPTGARHFFKVVQNNVPYFTIMPTGNVLVNTTTDAGYKLDVNGTTRFLSSTETISRFDHTNGNYASLVVGNGSALAAGQFGMYFNGGAMWSWNGASFRLHGNVLSTATNPSTLILQGGYGGSTVGTSMKLSSNTPNQGQWTATTGSQITVEIGSHSNETWAPSSGNASYTLLSVAPRINTTGTYAGIVRGIYYNPTLTSLTGTTHRAIETVTGDVLLATTSGTVVAGGTTVVNMNYGQVPKLYVSTGAFLDGVVQLPTTLRIVASGGGVSIAQQAAPSPNSLLFFGNDSNGVYYGNYGSLGLRFLVNNTAHMTIASTTGNVLINTTTDAGYKLDVNGTARFSGNTYLAGDILVSNGSGTRYIQSSNGGIGFLSSNSSGYNLWTANTGVGIKSELYINSDLNYNTGIRLRIGSTQTSPSGYSYELSFQPQVNHVPTYTAIRTLDSSYGGGSTTPSPIHIFGGQNTTSGTYAHVVLQSDFTGERGNVGVGTVSPAYKFHIASSAAANVFGTVQSTNANGTAAWVAFNDQSDNVVYRVFGSGASGTQLGVALSRSASLMANLGGSGKFLIGTYSGSDVAFGAGDQERMRIVNSTGNVLVGTVTDLGNKLEVSGTLNATAYKINNVPGYTGILTIVTNPPGMQNIDIQSGIIVNIF